LLQHNGSGRQSFERAQEDGSLPVSISSAFAKLGNVPPPVSETFLGEGTRRLQGFFPGDQSPHSQPACWAGYELYAVDGKAIKHVKRLLKPLRGLKAGILGARSAVALNVRTGQAVAMVGHLDGEAGEAALAEQLLPKMATLSGTKPWVAVLDRLYCNLTFPRHVLAAGGHFVIRYDAHTSFTPDAERPAQESRDAQGRTIVQRWGWLGKAKDRRRLYVREVTRKLPDGKDICVVTDLLDEREIPAEALLAMYRNRWGIEKVFHQITEVFSLKNLIGTSPQAVLFQLAFCLLLYNTLQVVRAQIAYGQKMDAEKISNEKLFYDVKRQMVSVNELVEVPRLLDMLGDVPTTDELREFLEARLQNVWSCRWKKAPSSHGGSHQKAEKTRVVGNHTSTYRELQKTNKGHPPSPMSP